MRTASAQLDSTVQILGIRFCNGDVDEAVASMFRHGGFLVAPSGTCFARLREDETYRRGVLAADLAIGSGAQEKLGYYLRENLSYRPAIHCIGAALGFVTGDQVSIPDWADRLYLGWFWRLVAQPSVFIPRLSRAVELPLLIWKYSEKLPPMREG